MKIVSADFVLASPTSAGARPDRLPQIAVAGRSNVGKSSLINTLTGRKALARTSSTPGCTQQIVLFRINDAFHFADLPGYGYAKVPRPVREEWGREIEIHLAARDVVRGVIVIFDVRRDVRDDDLDLLHWLATLGQPVIAAVTKLDKLGRNEATTRMAAWRRSLEGRTSLPPMRASSHTREGRSELLAAVKTCLAGELSAVSPEVFGSSPIRR